MTTNRHLFVRYNEGYWRVWSKYRSRRGVVKYFRSERFLAFITSAPICSSINRPPNLYLQPKPWSAIAPVESSSRWSFAYREIILDTVEECYDTIVMSHACGLMTKIKLGEQSLNCTDDPSDKVPRSHGGRLLRLWQTRYERWISIADTRGYELGMGMPLKRRWQILRVEKCRLQRLFMWKHIAGSSLDSICHTLALLSVLGDNKMTRS